MISPLEIEDWRRLDQGNLLTVSRAPGLWISALVVIQFSLNFKDYLEGIKEKEKRISSQDLSRKKSTQTNFEGKREKTTKTAGRQVGN